MVMHLTVNQAEFDSLIVQVYPHQPINKGRVAEEYRRKSCHL